MTGRPFQYRRKRTKKGQVIKPILLRKLLTERKTEGENKTEQNLTEPWTEGYWRQVSARLLTHLVKNCIKGRIKHVFGMELFFFSLLHNSVSSKELSLPSLKFKKDAHCIVWNLPHKGTQSMQRSWDGQISCLFQHLFHILTKPPNLPITHLLTIHSENKGTTTNILTWHIYNHVEKKRFPFLKWDFRSILNKKFLKNLLLCVSYLSDAFLFLLQYLLSCHSLLLHHYHLRFLRS